MFGGAAGGGKSDALLMGGLQWVEYPQYAGLILRRTYTDLALPGAIMARAQTWLGGTAARWHAAEHTWSFPSGATLTFGHMEYEKSKYRYQGADFQYIGFDELTQFTETQYRYMFTRLRKNVGSPIPLRMRSASNPGGIGHDWVKLRMVDAPVSSKRLFLPSRLQDNPHLNQAAYIESLKELDPITLQQMLEGDWSARTGGSLLRREWFGVPTEAFPNGMRMVRFWDLAATDEQEGKDPDYTAGCLLGYKDAKWYLLDIVRMRRSATVVEDIVKQIARADGTRVTIRMEQEPGASGKANIATYAKLLAGYDFDGIPSSGNKVARARPVAAAAGRGNVILIDGPWNGVFLDEADGFPAGSHDDMIDALSGAMAVITQELHAGPLDYDQPEGGGSFGSRAIGQTGGSGDDPDDDAGGRFGSSGESPFKGR